MTKIICKNHQNRNLSPVMIHFSKNSLGKQYICAICSGVRVFNTGKIVTLNLEKKYGFIDGEKENFFFHFSNLAYNFVPLKGMKVSFEVSFLDESRIQAIKIKPS